ncbi:MAG: hypothetical protein WDO73_27290 [Ignavibacteriota bacterium]
MGFWAPLAVPSWLIPAAVVAISIGLLAFAATRGRLAFFFLAWFAIAIAPVLPLRDHVSEYYAFVPAVGLCWLGGWAVVECWRSAALPRVAAAALAAVYMLIVVPRTLAGSEYHYRFSERMRNLVQGVARAHELHPSQAILLDGVDTVAFYNGVLDHPFRLVGVDRVYLTPASERQIQAHAEMGEVRDFMMPADELAKALDSDSVAVYDVRGPLAAQYYVGVREPAARCRIAASARRRKSAGSIPARPGVVRAGWQSSLDARARHTTDRRTLGARTETLPARLLSAGAIARGPVDGGSDGQRFGAGAGADRRRGKFRALLSAARRSYWSGDATGDGGSEPDLPSRRGYPRPWRGIWRIEIR